MRAREKPVLFLRVDPELHDRIADIAVSERRSVNAQAMTLIEEALKARQRRSSSATTRTTRRRTR
jgi:hypothetical protein